MVNKIVASVALSALVIMGCEKNETKNPLVQQVELAGLSGHLDKNREPLFLIEMKPGEKISKEIKEYSEIRLGVGIANGGQLTEEFRGTLDVALKITNEDNPDETLGTSFAARKSFKDIDNGALKLRFKNYSKRKIKFVIYFLKGQSTKIVK